LNPNQIPRQAENLCVFLEDKIRRLLKGNVESNLKKEEKSFLLLKRPYDFWINPNKMA
jgi:hypothetical protein